jgi:hypothetical protein
MMSADFATIPQAYARPSGNQLGISLKSRFHYREPVFTIGRQLADSGCCEGQKRRRMQNEMG